MSDFDDSVVRISGSKHGFGTGFIVHCDKQNTYILTCAHVVKDAGGEIGIKIRGVDAEVIAIEDNSFLRDLAVLRVPTIDGSPLPLGLVELPLSSGETFNRRVFISGFSKILNGEFRLKKYGGVIGGSGKLEPDTGSERIQTWDIKIDKDEEIKPGHSGSPVIDKASKQVIGVLRISENGRQGIAIDVRHLKDVWQEMPADLILPVQKTFFQKFFSNRLFIVLIIFLILTFGGGYTYTSYFVPKPMAGEFNIAVSYFVEIPQEGKEGRYISETIYRQLLKEAEVSDLDLQIRSPAQLKPVIGQTAQQRQANAKQLALDINADVVVYGVISQSNSMTEIIPEFWVQGNEFSEAEEFVDLRRLGMPIQVPNSLDNAANRTTVRQQIETRIEVLTFMVFGIGHYTSDHYEEARDYFLRADKIANEGKEVIYLCLGNVALKLRDYDQAQDYYLKAQQTNSNYSRPYVGLASIFVYEALGFEDLNKKTEYFDKAIALYKKALLVEDRPDNVEAEAKVHYGLGQIYVFQTLSKIATHQQEAEQELKWVIDAYRKEEVSGLRKLAADSSYYLGLLLKESANLSASSQEQQLLAAEHFKYCSDLLLQAPTKYVRESIYDCSTRLGDIYCTLGQQEAANKAYDTANEYAVDDSQKVSCEIQ